MNVQQLEAQAKALAPILRSYVEEREAAIRSEYDAQIKAMRAEFEQKLAEIPVYSEDSIAEKAAALIEKPADGVDGKDGKDGESVTLDDVRPVLDELVAEAVRAIPAPQDGEKGDTGPPGESVDPELVKQMVSEAVEAAVSAIELPKDGETGPQGPPGESVDPESIKSLVSQEVAKVITNIELPRDGEDGRDALDIEILPDIDPEKSYPRGTWAIHKGGLWRAFEKTTGMRGWECAVSGWPTFDVDLEDERTVVVSATDSKGVETLKRFSIPTMIYRGVWREGEYQKGDTVTWGGCVWHSNKDANADKPGQSEAWTLSAKKGRDGK